MQSGHLNGSQCDFIFKVIYPSTFAKSLIYDEGSDEWPRSFLRFKLDVII